MRLPLNSSGLRRVALLLFAVCLVLVAAAAALVQRANATAITLATFAKTGAFVWTVPKGVTIATFTVYGASGGGVLEHTANHTTTTISQGGLGGEAKATFTVHAGQKFEIVVGGQGGVAYLNESSGLAGAEGGGFGAKYGGGGGGGSDVRLGGRGNPCATTAICGSGERIIVGGGGGGGDGVLGGAANGLSGGGLTGGGGANCPLNNGLSGAQECGGSGGTGYFGGFGAGSSGHHNTEAGGGGGWWGGVGGDPGGGGSGYISPFAKSGSFPGGHQTGDGKVIITTTK